MEFESLVSAKEGGDFEPDVKVKSDGRQCEMVCWLGSIVGNDCLANL